jgi:glycosyltransferase involved in cell wall biosynthesis
LVSKATADVFRDEVKEVGVNVVIDQIAFSNGEPPTYLGVFLEMIKRAPLGSLKKVPKDINLIYSMTGVITEVMPGFVFKLRCPKLSWVVLMDNLVPPPSQRTGNYFVNLLAYLSFRLSVLLSKKADIILQVNSSVKKELLKLGINEGKIKHTSNGIMLDEIRRAGEPAIKKYEAVFLGRLNYTKGIFDLVKIWANVVRIKPQAKLALIGGGEKTTIRKLKNEIKKNNLENNIYLLGYLTPEEKFKALKEGKIFVFPSKISGDESWGIAIMEALNCGLPAVVYNLPVYEEIYGNLLYKIELNDIEGFSRKIIDLLDDPSLYKESLVKGVDFSRNFSWERVIEKESNLIISNLSRD